ncbi:hypothetical protein LMG29542_08609 [Paraburkholderia humisilvae]|uniref:Uncharacterized protein n=1 Tax=Paraburkholderia humisilvae TaxID=627669 RepID=A0A6J5FCP6_9BURK|nr:hypothetical protein LMG29542_08609 [Paraburkholderia humisilvae]
METELPDIAKVVRSSGCLCALLLQPRVSSGTDDDLDATEIEDTTRTTPSAAAINTAMRIRIALLMFIGNGFQYVRTLVLTAPSAGSANQS